MGIDEDAVERELLSALAEAAAWPAADGLLGDLRPHLRRHYRTLGRDATGRI